MNLFNFFDTKSTITLTWIRLVIIVVFSAAISSLIVTTADNRSFEHGLSNNAIASQKLTEERTRFTNLLSCSRANFQSALQVINISDTNDPITYHNLKDKFPILDCEATYDAGENYSIRIKPSVGQKYIAIVQNGGVPIVEGGKIIGTKDASISYKSYKELSGDNR